MVLENKLDIASASRVNAAPESRFVTPSSDTKPGCTWLDGIIQLSWDGNKQESVTQAKSKHNLPARDLTQPCVQGESPCACLYLTPRQASGKNRLSRDLQPGTGGGRPGAT